MQFLTKFHQNGVFPQGSIASFYTLISKGENPQNLGEFRPISLVGSMYKIISKILSNRLKRVMRKIIDKRQSAFMGGRYLLHSTLMENEVVDDAKRNRK